MQLKKPFIQH